jgi:hypothetical protein
MKHHTNPHLVICSGLALAFVLTVWSPVQAQSAAPAEVKHPMDATMMDRCQKMKQQKQKMMADMKVQDDQLMEQVAEMNRAPHDKKIGLMAAVLTHMAEQRIAMDARKAKMDEEMMQHMMEHMQMGKDSMSQCPMMKDMKSMNDMGDKSDDAHKEHHEEQK